MDESIFLEIKKLLGLDQSYEAFDQDILIHINTFLGVLNQLGVGKQGFYITGPTETWSQFLTDASVTLNEVKTYLYLRVRMVFDPPTSSSFAQAINDTWKELEWRINTKVDADHYKEENRL